MDAENTSGHSCVNLYRYRLSRSSTMIHSELRALHAYWDRLRAGRKAPMRSDIDPRDMECDARNLFILENLGRGNVRFRLAGTALVEAFGMELRGMNARAMMAAASRDSFTALICETLEDPGVGYARLREAPDEKAVWEISLLPLRSDFGMIDRVIGCLHPLTGAGARPRSAPLRFAIEKMSVDPIEVTARDLDLPQPVGGFAETREPFASGPEQKPHLTAIEGGAGADAPETGGRPHRGKPDLRLVKK